MSQRGFRIPKESEHSHQVTLFQWASMESKHLSELALMFAIPNAGAGAQSGQAGKMKGEGVKAGVPDLLLPAARGIYHGLFVEMKFNKNKPNPQQLWWHSRLEEQGFKVVVCYAWHEAKDVILAYLEMK